MTKIVKLVTEKGKEIELPDEIGIESRLFSTIKQLDITMEMEDGTVCLIYLDTIEGVTLSNYDSTFEKNIRLEIRDAHLGGLDMEESE